MPPRPPDPVPTIHMAMIAHLESGWWLSYDISADRTRKAVSVELGTHGWRHQYSGFLFPSLAVPAVAEIVDSAGYRLAAGDSLLAVRWCPTCYTQDCGNGLEVIPHRWLAL